MGRKRTRPGKHLLLFPACTAACLIAGSACVRPSPSPPVTQPPAVQSPLPAPETTEAPTARISPEEEAGTHLAAARCALASGDYSNAFIEIELASRHPDLSTYPEALFLSALFYADPGNPTGDAAKARELLRHLGAAHPQSPWVAEGRIVTGLLEKAAAAETDNSRLDREVAALEKQVAAERSSVQSLKSLLKKMKEIDLGIPPEGQEAP